VTVSRVKTTNERDGGAIWRLLKIAHSNGLLCGCKHCCLFRNQLLRSFGLFVASGQYFDEFFSFTRVFGVCCYIRCAKIRFLSNLWYSCTLVCRCSCVMIATVFFCSVMVDWCLFDVPDVAEAAFLFVLLV